MCIALTLLNRSSLLHCLRTAWCKEQLPFAMLLQLVGANDDGKLFDEQDAQLDLSAGQPRFYIMRLPRRGRRFERITYHAQVTQCLGGLQVCVTEGLGAPGQHPGYFDGAMRPAFLSRAAAWLALPDPCGHVPLSTQLLPPCPAPPADGEPPIPP